MAGTATMTLFRGAAATSTTTLYTTISGESKGVANIAITNTATSTATTTINFGSVSVISGISIPANSTQLIDLQQVITNGETITASASTTAVNIHIAGYGIL